MNALNAFGMAIGWMDIVGVLFFELIMFYMMRRRRLAQKSEVVSIEAQSKCHRDSLPSLFCRKKLSESENIWIFWGYLLMLNVWIGVTLLMIAGISFQKPELMTFWLIWCACGLVFDVFLILWWVYELFVGDAIEALTNILISLLTMAIEFGFIYVIYSIFLNLSNATNDAETKVVEKARYSFMMLSDQKR
ncbi:uncharacterized protein LOC6546341 isoform X1 [Drosophila erecta]|uniref:Uncharacterized protein n=2 Tax=Drosophila erecta TaxID=7220 RepID=B3NCL4_DROER|nr:uncharacterized protein LOC6546341 isoform X1 [Drosophila erecta]EDV51311.2 uncharacterized protein Dere_GG13970 [Drosophila erecta]